MLKEPLVEDDLEATPILNRCLHEELDNFGRVRLDEPRENEDERLNDRRHAGLKDFVDDAHEEGSIDARLHLVNDLDDKVTEAES